MRHFEPNKGTDNLYQVKGSCTRRELSSDLQWRQTLVWHERTAEKLVMKSTANVSRQIRRLERKKALATVSQELKVFPDETDV